MFPNLSTLVQQAIIPTELKQDQLLWSHTTHGDLELKNAYGFKLQSQMDISWAKHIRTSNFNVYLATSK